MLTFEYLISEERKRQDGMWGEQDHEPLLWLPILVEEVGEVATAILCGTFKPDKQKPKDLETELIHVAAVAKAMWECGKRNKWIK